MRHPTRRALILGLAMTTALSAPAAAGGTDRSSNPRSHDRSRPIVVDTTHDTPDARPGDGRCADAAGKCSLRAAFQTAADGTGLQRIQLRRATYHLTVAGTDGDGPEAGDLDVTGRVHLAGKGATIDLGGFDDRAFDVAADGSLDIDHLTVRNASLTDGRSGGAIRNAGSLQATRLVAKDNVVVGAGASGGAILNTGTMAVRRSTFTGNRADRAGGAVEAAGGTTTISSSVLAHNSTGPAPGNGGALHLTGAGVVTVESSKVVDNVAASEGGGLWNSGTGTMTVTRTQLRGNEAQGVEADQGGGGLFNDGGTMVVTRSWLHRNRAANGSGSGGGILNLGTLDVRDTTISSNTAARAGGGVESNDVLGAGDASLRRVWMVDNRTGPTPGNGGGMHVTGSSVTTVIDSSVIAANRASNEGGGLWNFQGATMTVTRNWIAANRAPVGRNVFQNGTGGNFTIDGVTVPAGPNDR